MPGITMMRPQGQVHIVRQPAHIRPPPPREDDPRDQIAFSRADREYFHVEKILGFGGFGMAARVRVLKSDRKFRKDDVIVVKQIAIKSSRDKQRLAEEYKIGKDLGKHENLVQMFAHMDGCVDGSGRPCERLFMRYCNAGSLYDLARLHRKSNLPLPEGFLWYVLGSMGYALARMHNGLRRDTHDRSPDWIGYVHYDIKADNILLNWSGDSGRKKFGWPTPKLADYGCSGRVGRTPKWLGHRLYFSPEIARDKYRPALPQADIWALGLTMYELMEFTNAFPVIKVRGGDQLDYNCFRPMQSRYGSSLRNIVMRCLDLDYRKRPDAEQLFLECRKFKKISREKGYKPWGHHKLLFPTPI